ncbi:DUF2637 domain-containing protein [Dactylosporangium sp. CA-092794]|uniref:DUF2637 domain-containing protein n=1 Tax=Dactylosporangium sp. CA-092794 TaxID=3239929 RepID=UPI003D8B7C7C
MFAIGGAAGAASFTHVHNLATAHGQGGWLAWADAVVLELMSGASGLEIRRRKRQHKSVHFPAVVLVCAVTLSIAAQVVEAERSVIGWLAAALPALGFLVMVKIALGRMTPVLPATRQPALPAPVTAPQSVLPINPAVPGNATGASDRHRVERRSDGKAAGSIATRGDDASQAKRPRRGRASDPGTAPDVAHLLPAATAAQQALRRQGRPLTHKALTDQLRADGHRVSNARAVTLRKILNDRPGASPTPQSEEAEVVSTTVVGQ